MTKRWRDTDEGHMQTVNPTREWVQYHISEAPPSQRRKRLSVQMAARSWWSRELDQVSAPSAPSDPHFRRVRQSVQSQSVGWWSTGPDV